MHRENRKNAWVLMMDIGWRIGVLATIIRRLRSGEDEEQVLATLRLHVDRLPREARRHYERGVARLEEAARRDWVFDKDRREASLEEAVMELWMTRAEYLKEMVI